MTLDVEPPAPPSLSVEESGGDGDARRAEIQDHLADGAWAEAFETWAAETDLDREAWTVVADLGMVQHFDFFWDEFVQRVGYHAPGLPEDWQERTVHEDLESWETVSSINAAMAELGDTVGRVLTEEYVEFDPDDDLPDDLPDFE